MIYFINNDTNEITTYSNGMTYIAQASSLTEVLLKTNKENEKSNYSFKLNVEGESIKISDVYLLKVNVKNVGAMLISINKDSFDDEARQKVIETLSDLKSITSDTSEGRIEKITKVLEGIKEVDIYYIVFELKDNSEDVFASVSKFELNYPLLLLNIIKIEDDFVDLKLGEDSLGVTPKRKEKAPKKERAPKKEGGSNFGEKFKEIMSSIGTFFKKIPTSKVFLDIKKNLTARLFALLFSFAIPAIIYASYNGFAQGSYTNGIVFIIIGLVFAFALYFANVDLLKRSDIANNLKGEYPILIEFISTEVIALILGVVAGYFLAFYPLKIEDAEVNYGLGVVITILVTIVIEAGLTVLAIFLKKRGKAKDKKAE